MPPLQIRPGVRRLVRLALRRRDAAARGVDDEIALHLELRTEQLVARGYTPAAARAEAERRFGALDEARRRLHTAAQRQEVRMQLGERLHGVRQDVRYALRGLGRAPGFATVVIATLALGIGAAVAVFSVVNGVLLRPLPYPEPARVAAVFTRFGGLDLARSNLSEPEYLDVAALPAFASVALTTDDDVTITGAGTPERAHALRATATLFPTLGVPALVGRTYGAAEDRPGRDQVAVLGYGYWQRRFGGDRGVVGRTIVADGTPRAVVGVMPPEFRFGDAELYLPVALDPDSLNSRGAHNYQAVARLARGVTVAQAGAQLAALATRLRADYPQAYPPGIDFGLHAMGLQESLVGDVRPALAVLVGVVGLVLLIACANAATLLLVRGGARQRELGVRIALGANRGRIARQLLTESALLALVAGALGLAGGAWGVRALVAVNPDALPRHENVGVDSTVAVAALAIAAVTGLLFGALPAFHAGRGALPAVLKGGARGGSSPREGRLRRALVTGELALAVVVVVAAGLLLRSFWTLRAVDAGLDSADVLTMATTLPEARYPEPRVHVAFAELLDRVRAVRGVEAAGAVALLPLGNNSSNWDIEVEGRAAAPGAAAPSPRPQVLTPGALEAMRIRVVRGRTLGPADDERAPVAALVNQAMARALWPGRDAVGGRFRLAGGSRAWATIVGVVADVRSAGLAAPVLPEFYVPHAQFFGFAGGQYRNLTIVARTTGDPAALAEPARRAVQAGDPELAVSDVRTMREVVDRSVAQPRFTMLLLVTFGAVALLLAAVGVYGVISYSVAQRTRELGVRVALGARRADVLRLVVGEGLAIAAGGVALGLGGALAATRLLRALLYGVSPTDPLTFAAIAALLLAVAVLASAVPARRAARADPMAALRGE